MHWIDWSIIAAYMALVTAVGFAFLKRASGGVAEFFVAGRNLPWWIAGTSLIATSFAADTPLAITKIVAEKGIAGNWLWWNQGLAWILAVVLFAKLWRRAGLITDAEFMELRYGGKPGAFLRGFKAAHSVFISTYTLAWVMLAMQKIVSVTMAEPEWSRSWQNSLESAFGLPPDSVDFWKWLVLIVLFLVATLYTVVSGYWGIVVTDLLQFAIAMIVSVVFAFYAVDAVGGMSALHAKLTAQLGEQQTHDLLAFVPAVDSTWMPLTTFAIFLSVLWWGDCGGFAAQRMFSTRSDRDSTLAALWYSIGHFVLRPWPWIVVALVTLVYYPQIEDRELGYPQLMMEILPVGVRGLMVASLLAAFMSTVDTHLNWNASYFVNDVYMRFINPRASGRRCILMSRLSTVGFAALAIVVAYFMTSIADAWVLLFNLQAGVGMVLMLRWLWWRVNVWSEVSAMSMSLIATFVIQYMRKHYGFEWSDAYCILLTVEVCTVTWLAVTLLTPAADNETLCRFYRRVRPIGGFWRPISDQCTDVAAPVSLARTIAMWLLGTAALFAVMFATGKLVLGETVVALAVAMVALAFGAGIWAVRPRGATSC